MEGLRRVMLSFHSQARITHIQPSSYGSAFLMWQRLPHVAAPSSCGGTSSLTFYRTFLRWQPPEHRVLATCDDVRARTGQPRDLNRSSQVKVLFS